MKKLVTLFSIVLFALFLCSCSQSLDSAVNEADELITQWNYDVEYGCSYKGEFDTTTPGGPFYFVTVRDYPLDKSDIEKRATFGGIKKDLYPELEKLLQPHEICIILTYADRSGGDTYAAIANGDVEYF